MQAALLPTAASAPQHHRQPVAPAAFVSNLPADATEGAVRAAFEAAGVHVVSCAALLQQAPPLTARSPAAADRCCTRPRHHATSPLPQSSVQLLKKGPSWRSRNAGLACVTLRPGADVAASCAALDGVPLLDRPMIVRRDRFVQDQHSYVASAAEGAAKGAAEGGEARVEAAGRDERGCSSGSWRGG